LKLLKVAAWVIGSVRRVIFHLASNSPFRDLFLGVLSRVMRASPLGVGTG
jgi:hypothetical protein